MVGTNLRAVVLKNINFKDSDKIYTLFTRDRGKISAIAKGVRKINSRRGGNLDSLNYINVHINPHKSGQNYITEVSVIDSFKNVKQNYELVKDSMYITELINRFTWEDENTHKIFDLLVKTLTLMNTNYDKDEVLTNKFEIKLLKFLGYQPPRHLLELWVEKVNTNQKGNADMFIKNFVLETLQERIKSLEI